MNTAYSPVDPATTPKDLPYLLGSDIGIFLASSTLDTFGFPMKYYLERILDLLGYPVAPGDPNKTLPLLYAKDSGTMANNHFNPFRLFALARIYYEFYRQSDYESNIPSSYNLDKLS